MIFNPHYKRKFIYQASFGVAVFPEHGDSVTELIQKADQAMYRVKYSGKNAVQMAI